jgi:peptidoglycan/xylan/chitin deacetylase (PgdA/CDA1 family)
MKVSNFPAKKFAKLALYFILFYSGLLGLLVMIWQKMKKRNTAVILFYHRFKEDNEDCLPEKLWIRTFESQMYYIKKWYNVTSLNNLVESIKNKKDFEKPTIVVTIDDGFKDNYDLAFPILKKLNLPCTIFLTSGLIGTGEAPWVDEIGYAFQYSRGTSFAFPGLFGDELVKISNQKEKTEAWQRIYEKMLYLENDLRLSLLKDLLRMLEGDRGHERIRDRVMLTWHEVTQMKENDIYFGAHTLSHPTLSKMDSKQAMFEISESKRQIEEQLGVQVRHFAIPNGRNEDFTDDLREFCKNCGFVSIVTTSFGVVKKESDLYNLPRISISSSLFFFASELAKHFMTVK